MRMSRQRVLDIYFIEARSKLIDVAAFLDRVERAEGEADFRQEAFCRALAELKSGGDCARRVLLALSDPTTEPIEVAGSKGATGAWAGGRD
jgi:hypothetical protein